MFSFENVCVFRYNCTIFCLCSQKYLKMVAHLYFLFPLFAGFMCGYCSSSLKEQRAPHCYISQSFHLCSNSIWLFSQNDLIGWHRYLIHNKKVYDIIVVSVGCRCVETTLSRYSVLWFVFLYIYIYFIIIFLVFSWCKRTFKFTISRILSFW